MAWQYRKISSCPSCIYFVFKKLKVKEKGIRFGKWENKSNEKLFIYFIYVFLETVDMYIVVAYFYFYFRRCYIYFKRDIF